MDANSPNAKKPKVIRGINKWTIELEKIFDELYNELFKQSNRNRYNK